MSDWWGVDQPTRVDDGQLREIRSTIEAIHKLVRLGVVLFVVCVAAGGFAWLYAVTG